MYVSVNRSCTIVVRNKVLIWNIADNIFRKWRKNKSMIIDKGLIMQYWTYYSVPSGTKQSKKKIKCSFYGIIRIILTENWLSLLCTNWLSLLTELEKHKFCKMLIKNNSYKNKYLANQWKSMNPKRSYFGVLKPPPKFSQ